MFKKFSWRNLWGIPFYFLHSMSSLELYDIALSQVHSEKKGTETVPLGALFDCP